MIYFVRHGETDYNKEKRSQGQLDIPLNQTGIEQAKQTAEKLKDIHFDIIYASPLSRAKLTAQIINQRHNVPIVFDDRLKEFQVGQRQGQLFGLWPEEIKKKYIEKPEDYGAEGYQNFYNRVVEFYKTIENDTRDILIVSHGGVYLNLYRYFNNITDFLQSLTQLENCEIKILKN